MINVDDNIFTFKCSWEVLFFDMLPLDRQRHTYTHPSVVVELHLVNSGHKNNTLQKKSIYFSALQIGSEKEKNHSLVTIANTFWESNHGMTTIPSLRNTYIGPFTNRFRALCFIQPFEEFRGKYHISSKKLRSEYSSLRSKLWMANKSTYLKLVRP